MARRRPALSRTREQNSGAVLGRLREDLQGYGGTKSALHFPIDRPLPKLLVHKLIRAKLEELTSLR